MKIKKSAMERITDVIIYTILTILALLCLYPLYQVLVVSFSDPAIVMATNGFLFWPKGFHLDAYKIVFSNQNIWIGFQNTLFYILAGTSLQYALTALAAYPLSKNGLMLKRPLMIYMTITMYFSGGMIPFFLLINQLGLMNSRWAMIIPSAVNVWNIIVMRTQFNSIPDGLKDAATIDGANDITMLIRILLPLSGAVSAVLLLFSAVSYWNMWYEPMIFLTDRGKYPIQSVLREILIDNSSQMMAGKAGAQVKFDHTTNAAAQTLVKYANIIVCTVPILVVYPFAQKFFVKGVMIGSLKG